jgi:hypothetical protein
LLNAPTITPAASSEQLLFLVEGIQELVAAFDGSNPCGHIDRSREDSL